MPTTGVDVAGRGKGQFAWQSDRGEQLDRDIPSPILPEPLQAIIPRLGPKLPIDKRNRINALPLTPRSRAGEGRLAAGSREALPPGARRIPST